MARKKTKKQKRATATRKEQQQEPVATNQVLTTPTFDASILGSDADVVVTPKKQERKLEKRPFGFDPRLIKADLQKTIMLSAVILGIEVALFVYLG